MDDTEFRLFIERVKERVPIEDVVRERVPELKKAGALFKACCPFHDERTPSFTVDPRRGTWHCFGACGTGGDVLSFVQRFDGSSFIEALEQLAQVAGVELPRSVHTGRGRSEDGRLERMHEVLARAAQLYQRKLRGPEGEAARDYLTRRGLAPETWEVFGLGVAPPHGSPLLAAATRSGHPVELLIETGLVRRGQDGGAYDFFRGRLLIPIRDRLGRTVGFGARRLEDPSAADAERAGPKYVNTPETPVFHKGRLIYALDRALAGVRRTRHLVLVEGYTDVMAAHQVGLDHVAAVLGTATTDDHAALVRRSGAKRISLVFDGDEAGRLATHRALHGLLPLGLEIDVVSPPPGRDPCDLLIERGAEGLTALLETATPWFEYLKQGLRGLDPAALSAAVDGVLALLDRLRAPVQRDASLRELAAWLELPEAGLREQWAAQHRGRPSRPAGPAPEGTADEPAAPRPRSAEVPPRSPAVAAQIRRAYEELLGATLLDNSLIPAVAPWFEAERADELLESDEADAALARIAGRVLELYENTEDPVDASSVLAALGEDPARDRVVPLEARAMEYTQDGATAQALAAGAAHCLEIHLRERAVLLLASRQASGDEEQRQRARRQLFEELRRMKVPAREE